ncbi:N-acetyltransferase family protein [Streptococcus sp. 10F2]
MSIRLAKPNDIPAILNLLEEILAVHHKGRPDIFKASGSKYNQEQLAEILEDPKQFLFVYEQDNQILGHLFCQIQEAQSSVLNPIKTLFIDDLCVSHTARGQGIGEKFIAFAKAYAKEHGCYNLTLDVWADNDGAVRFYERLGFQPQKIRMEEIL